MKYTVYTTIETDDTDYKLSALLEKDGSYSMVSLEVPESVDKNTFWDNSNYLIDVLYPFLQKKKDKTQDDDGDKSYKLIPKDRRKEVKGLIKQGKKLGFFNDIIK